MSAQQPSQGPRWFILARDLAALTFPWVLIFKQAGILFEPPASVNEPILWLAGAMLGVPGVAQILALRFGGGTTEPSPPQGAQPASQAGSSSTSTSQAEAP